PPVGMSPQELSGWSYKNGQDNHIHYLIVDDIDQIPDGPATAGPYVGQRPWTPLIGLLSQASDLGLRVIVTARAAGSAHAVMTAPLLRRLNDLQATTVMLSGNPQDSGKIRGHRFSRLPAGRAMLLDDSDTPTFVQLVNPLATESVTANRGPGRHCGEEYS
ncbi:MAG: type VII secretion protein EccC, partial [Mycobacterium sp.]